MAGKFPAYGLHTGPFPLPLLHLRESCGLVVFVHYREPAGLDSCLNELALYICLQLALGCQRQSMCCLCIARWDSLVDLTLSTPGEGVYGRALLPE